VNGAPQLSVLRPATPAESPNSFLNSGTVDFVRLATQFLQFWNGKFAAAGNVGNKIGTITGYTTNVTSDSIIFFATSSDYGPIVGGYDVINYYSNATYEVTFRVSSNPIIYKTNPIPGKSPSTGSTETGSPISINVSGSDSGSLGSPYSVINPANLINILHYVRYVKFIVLSSGPANTYNHAEISRIAFHIVASPSSYTQVDVRAGSVSVEGIYESYYLPPNETVCKPGYNLVIDSKTLSKFCQVASPDIYTPVDNTACGIGYITKSTSGAAATSCQSTGYFQEILDTNSLFTANQYTPRLRINKKDDGSYKYVQIDFRNVIQIDAFSFITGSQNTLPLTWVLLGSIDVNTWLPLHTQSTPFNYNHNLPGTTIAAPNAFYNPGIFPFNTPGKGSQPAPSVVTQSVSYGNNVGVEGFKVPKRGTGARIQLLRFTVLETQDDDSPFVHMSMLEFHTSSGMVPSNCIRISNPQGSRRSGKDGPDSLLLSDCSRRWVDYNKSELLIQFKTDCLSDDPIYGFRFHMPCVGDEPISSVPAKWVLEGSYDRRSWIVLHRKDENARFMENKSPIYKFLESV
jgi:hypothetical protein